MLKVLKKSFIIIVVSIFLCHLMTIHTENEKKEQAEMGQVEAVMPEAALL